MVRPGIARCLRWVSILLLLQATPATARDTELRRGPVPEKNFSNIHAGVEWIVTAFQSAASSAQGSDWASAVRTLQAVIDAETSRESDGDAAPYVRAVRGSTVYEGAWIVARHTIAGWGADALEACAQEYGAAARTLLGRGVARRDEGILAETARRFLVLPEGRRAALLLVDIALEQEDRDRALEWLEALEDLESVTAEDPDGLRPWREARIARQAQALARSPADVPAVRAALAAADPGSAVSVDAVPAGLLRAPPVPRGWPTTGGNAARSAVPPPLGADLQLRWFRTSAGGADLVDAFDPAPRPGDRPSVWLPPRAVASEEHLFVSDGRFLHVYDLDSGELMIERKAGAYPAARRIGSRGDEDRRALFGLLEGHALTAHPVRDFQAHVGRTAFDWHGPGHLLLAAVPDGRPWPVPHEEDRFGGGRNDHIQALYWDGRALVPLWRAGGVVPTQRTGGLPPDTRLYGAPAVYRGRAWVAGVRPAMATPDRWEAWIFSLDLGTGRVLTRTHLGTGTPVRPGRIDEVIPSSPAAAHGRVVVSTTLGMLGAVDARDGRVCWMYRYDRAVETERGIRRNRVSYEEGPRPSSFANEPPILTRDRCYATPTDSDQVLTLFNRPRARSRYLTCMDLDRMTASSSFMVEYVAGVVPGRADAGPVMAVVGQGMSGMPPGPLVVAWDARGTDYRWPKDAERRAQFQEQPDLWDEPSPTGFGADPFGRAAVTATEVFVPTRHGIAVYSLFDRPGKQTHYLGVLNREDIPADLRPTAPPVPFGNLIPVPGRGLVAVSATTIALWARP